MFIFHWVELLIVVLGGLVLFLGLALVALRRRNEVLQDFLLPEENRLEEEFFRVRQVVPKEESSEEADEEATDDSEEPPVAQWGS